MTFLKILHVIFNFCTEPITKNGLLLNIRDILSLKREKVNISEFFPFQQLYRKLTILLFFYSYLLEINYFKESEVMAKL